MSERDDEIPEADDPETTSGTALAEGTEGADAPFKMSLTVDIENAGPCKKHVKVVVPRADLDHFYNEAVRDLVTSAAVPGFRTGHVPRKLIEKRFRKEVGEQVRQKVLMQSLQQLGEDYKLDAINEPDLDVESLVLPEEGDFSYEFDIEVRPEFDLPDYKGLSIKRPVRAITDGEVQAHLENYLAQFGQLVPHDGPAEAGDYILTNLRFESSGAELSHSGERQIRIRPTLRFTDAEVAGFDRLMQGVRPGEKRQSTTKI